MKPTTAPVAGLALPLGWALVLLFPGTSWATSCAPHPSASPQAIASATEELSVPETYRERYDGALLGTVLDASTEQGGPDHGRTEVLVTVTGTFGPALSEEVVVIEPDPGWVSGYGLEPGTHYFIPYIVEEGELRSELCDPITEVDISEVDELVATASQHPWLETAGAPPNDAAGPPVRSSSGSGSPTRVIGGGLLTAGLMALGWYGVRSRR